VVVQFVSTEGRSTPVGLGAALLTGIAEDGGLYMPRPLEELPLKEVSALRGCSVTDVATRLAPRLFGNTLEPFALQEVVEQALNFSIPLVRVSERTFLLELFHGPTLAFKDVGARFMATLLDRIRPHDDDRITILTATSGDTGGAVAQAFHNVPRTRVVVLFPEGRVSAVQQRQFSTLGGNVRALAVSGSFDDCQHLAKQAFANRTLAARHRLTSANSINIGRLLPQAIYYASAWAALPTNAGRVIVATPSGNFGNLTAGLIARRLGVPIDRFVAATNVNDVVPEYLSTGVFRPRASVATISNAMDVGDPSNFARMLALYDGDVDAMRRDVQGSVSSDDETRACIARVHKEFGRLLDPHTAVAWLGMERALAADPSATGIVLATAHPAKFAEVVEPVIGEAVAMPERLAACLKRQPVVDRISARLPELVEVLQEGW